MPRSFPKNTVFPAAAWALFALLARDIRREVKGAIQGEDVEHVHRMRTSTSRLRIAALLMADEAGLRRGSKWVIELKWLAGALGDARDLDVMGQRLVDCAGKRPSRVCRLAVDRVGEPLAVRRDRAYAKMARELKSQRGVAILGHLKRLAASDADLWKKAPRPEESCHEALPLILAPAFDEFLRRRRRMLRNMSLERIHKFRLRVKRLRYIGEFFERDFNGRGKELTAAFKAISDCLGEERDLAMLEATLLGEQFGVAQSTEPADNDYYEGLAQLLERSHARRHALDSQFTDLWNRLHSKRGALRRIEKYLPDVSGD